MRRLSQIISAYVALCLALAGMVGLSPSLHLLIEHGGLGTPHRHALDSIATGNFHHHADGSSHDADHQAPGIRAKGLGPLHIGFTPTHQPFELPSIRLPQAGRALLQFLAGASNHPEESPSPDQQSNHHFNSLTQLLSHGLVEVVVDLRPQTWLVTTFIWRTQPAEAFLSDPGWEAQTATRGPPLVRS